MELEGTEGMLSYEVTHQSSRYLGVKLTAVIYGGGGEFQHVFSQTFALDGIYSGNLITLSQLLGMESQIDLVRQTAYDLVWQIAAGEMLNADSDYLDGLTLDRLQSVFDPETDFCLDEYGNIVFYIQAGEIAGEIAGVLTFPFSQSELLSVAVG